MIVLLISWFVTSSDSGILAMCTMLSMGDEHPPVKLRLFWGITSGVVAGVLLLAGGLSALQTASIVAGLPIAVMLLSMGYDMAKTLREDFPLLDVEDKAELKTRPNAVPEPLRLRATASTAMWSSRLLSDFSTMTLPSHRDSKRLDVFILFDDSSVCA